MSESDLNMFHKSPIHEIVPTFQNCTKCSKILLKRPKIYIKTMIGNIHFATKEAYLSHCATYKLLLMHSVMVVNDSGKKSCRTVGFFQSFCGVKVNRRGIIMFQEFCGKVKLGNS